MLNQKFLQSILHLYKPVRQHMPEFSSYTDWVNSAYYLLLKNTNTQNQFEFITGLIQRLQPAPGSKLIEVGCGIGQISNRIAELGLEVTGVDYSHTLIEIAKQGEKENLHFYQHDIRLPFWINYFNQALILSGSFGHFATLREHDNTIRAISQSLKTDGLVVMDYLNVHYEEAYLLPTEQLAISGLQFTVTRWQNDETFFKKIQLKQEGEQKDLFTEQTMKLSIGDFTEMFAFQGLQIQEVFGDYNFVDYDIKKSPRLIFIAKKIKR